MLPEPTYSFTIPSVRDDIDLECRIYHPTRFRNREAVVSGKWTKRGAIIAHPYAPLGGCYDDPIVASVASVILKSGIIVGTFNFRGAGACKGHTTWTAKGETDDYISFLGFFVHYMHLLDPPMTNSASSSIHLPASGSPLLPIKSAAPEIEFVPVPSPMNIVIGGYSYGSLIAMNLPGIDTILSRFETAIRGSAEAEIRLRATNMSHQWNKKVQERQRGRSLNVENAPRSPSGMLCGGDESEPGVRRLSRDSRRSVDRSRKRLSRGRYLGESDDSLGVSATERPTPVAIPEPRISFLLLSPVLPPMSSFATMFSEFSWFGRTSSSPCVANDKLTRHVTLAIYGDKDFFTSSKKLDKWASQLTSEPHSMFRARKVIGAGHFWHEEGVESIMQDTVREWAYGI